MKSQSTGNTPPGQGGLIRTIPEDGGGNVLGLYGDDARYTKSGEKLLAIAWNCILQESARAWNLKTKKNLCFSVPNLFCQ